MQMRIIGNVWLGGRAHGCGEVLDLPEPEAERLAVLGVAEPASIASSRIEAAPEPEPVQEAVDRPPVPDPVEDAPVHAQEVADCPPAPPAVDVEPVSKPKRKRGKR